jgi:hypothetical protein
MKFINYLKDIHNVQIYPMFTLILFITVFVLATILVFSKSRKTITEIKNLPLED